MNITGSILKNLRIKKNITLEQLATEINEKFDINLTRSMLSKWETSKVAPVYDHLKRLASYYGVTTDFLLGFDQDKYSTIAQSNKDLKLDKKRIRNPKKFFIREDINNLLKDDSFTDKDLIFIQDFIMFLKSKKNK